MSEFTSQVALVTGANKGIGFEIAKQLGLKGIKVYVGTRSLQNGYTAVDELKSLGINASSILIDLNDEQSIQDAYTYLNTHEAKLDILVNNAGIIDTEDGIASQTALSSVRRTFDTNFFGTLLVTQKMLPLVKKATSGRIVNISSGLGSLTLNADPNWEHASTKLIGYNSSKAAVNMLTVQLAWELKKTAIKVNAANPNFTATELIPNSSGGRPISEGAATAIQLALLPDDGPTGQLFEDGQVLPW
ncbi:hypothetical protein P256_00799 [Acinetobacter nectaris CIP 110549]|uniref:Uncharacterized protein n=1 Tax=Acinetobacter nectaris CIP 110549 TaxID=1392540 RepID=V2TRX9_9GAMM|nr:SDR family NAD(P)-dependent oxidoreductase [Acinetobacter nectaris]ESK40352.1 hypothetical protein P256_00799 [Acinetobacter nectaris CIP 110549]